VTASPTITPAQAIDALWRVGDLSYLLHETQEKMRRAIALSMALLFVLNCARRLGKSYLCCVLAIEMCLQKRGSRVLYIAPTAKQVRTIITPIMRLILADAPADLRPEFASMDGIWKFPNGSEIHIVGVNNGHADDARGGDADLVIVDEAGMIDELAYLMESVIKPMLLVTNGRVVMPSTPASTPAHAFTEYCAKAEAANSYAKFTIYDAPHIPRDRAEEFIAEGGGRRSSNVRREYFCEHVVDTTLAVLPEFGDVEEAICVAHERPKYFVPLIVGDVGYHDLSFFLFGYHDFRNGLDVIEAEYVVNKTVAQDLATEVDRIAVELWGDDKAKRARRFADAAAMELAEMNKRAVTVSPWTGIAKTQTDGHFKTAAVNDVRTRLGAKSLRIAPTCAQLRSHARYGVWRIPGHDLARMDGFGHFDGIDALTYFVRCIDRRTNPHPRIPEGASASTHIIPDEWLGEESGRENLRNLARRGSSKR
jgi:hypothetical protein